MSKFVNAKSAKSPIHVTGSDITTAEAFVEALKRGLDKVWKRTFDFPAQGLGYFREESIKREDASFQTYRGAAGLVPQNRDTDDIPFVSSADGFGYQVRTYNYRRGIAHERTLEEVDDVGVIRGRQRDLARMGKLTIEYACSDVFNRGIYVDGGSRAPILADDGCFLVDEDRPNADPLGGTWSNKESTSAITETSLFQAQLNARKMVGEDGELFPTYIQKLIIAPDDEKTLWTLLKSDKKVSTSLNDANWGDGRFTYEIYDWLTSSYIYYLLSDPKSEDNELQFFWRVRPQFETWKGADNPDVIKQRVRMSFGLGLGSPRKHIRGGVVTR